MNEERTILEACEIICIGESNPPTALIACPLPKEDQLKCKQRRQYKAGMREVLSFAEKILDLAEHGDYSNGNVEYGTDEGSVGAWRVLNEYRKQLEAFSEESE